MAAKRKYITALCFFPVLFFNSFRVDTATVNIQRHFPAGNNASLQFFFNYAATTPLLSPPYVSGIVNDLADPAAVQGIWVSVKENNKPLSAADYGITVAADNKQVLPDNSIVITKEEGQANIRILPARPGYCNITLTLTRGRTTTALDIFYAASAGNSELYPGTLWHTGVSDASAALALDSNYMVIGDDENNVLLVYDRARSGLPVSIFNYAHLMNLPDGDASELDCEAGARSLRNPLRTYWAGSMSNGGGSFREQPNRNCLFAVDISGTGASTQFSYRGNYFDLRRHLIKWGDENGYKFSSSTASGKTAKQPGGFNIEGMVFAPDSNTLYIGFRAPIVPVTNRTKALIAPVENFEQWFNDGKPSGRPVIGKPIEFDLGGRGIRDLIHLQNGSYVIIAGNSDELFNAALYTWSGKPGDAPVLVNAMEKFPSKAESGLEIDQNGFFTGKMQIISDNGSTIFYGDGTPAKLLNKNFAKFRDDVVELSPVKIK